MSAVKQELPAWERTVELLARVIDSDEFDSLGADILDLVGTVANCYTGEDRAAIYLSWEFCPVHERDIGICKDDGAKRCRSYQ